MERLASIDGGDPALEQSFAALAFEEQRDETLGRWANDSEKRQARWDNVLTALSRMLDTNWRPSSAFLGRAFSAAPALARWRASEFLAQRNLLAAACALGETVPNDLPASQACSAWAELARWWVAQGDPDEAITRLDRAIDCAPSAISFSEPLFAALRARWLLTPEDQRATFEEQVSLRLGKLKHGRGQIAAAALIASLNGNDSLAAGKIAEAVRDLGNSNDESWAELIQQGGNQLEEWNLHRLARDLYRADLAKDSALLSMRGENFQDSTTELLIINQLVSADRTRVPYLLNEWLSRGVSERKLLDASVRIQQAGRAETAALLYQSLCERDPRNDGICAGILNLARIPLMRQHGISFLERLLAEESPEVGRAMIQMAGLRLAGILDEKGEYDRSLALLDRLGRGGALTKTLLFQHVQALRRAGRHREDLSELEKNSLLADSLEFVIPMAELYAAFGRERDPMPFWNAKPAALRPTGRSQRRSFANWPFSLAISTGPPPRRRFSARATPLPRPEIPLQIGTRSSATWSLARRLRRSAFAPAKVFSSWPTFQPPFAKSSSAASSESPRELPLSRQNSMSCEGNLRKNSGRGEIS